METLRCFMTGLRFAAGWRFTKAAAVRRSEVIKMRLGPTFPAQCRCSGAPRFRKPLVSRVAAASRKPATSPPRRGRAVWCRAVGCPAAVAIVAAEWNAAAFSAPESFTI